MRVSILIPAIRTKNWPALYESLQKACTNYSFELVLVSPFDLPEEMKGIDNIKHIKDYGCPSRASQIGVMHCDGEFLYNCVDDAIFYPNVIDKAVDRMFKLGFKDVINMRYREGEEYEGGTLEDDYWIAGSMRNKPALGLPGIDPTWKIALHFFMRTRYFRKLGGFDCRFEYVNHGAHDLMFRVQNDGGTVYNSEVEATNCDHYPGVTKDHAPIHFAQTTHDEPLFRELYAKKDALKFRTRISYVNYKSCPEVWSRRFPRGRVENYEDLGYDV